MAAWLGACFVGFGFCLTAKTGNRHLCVYGFLCTLEMGCGGGCVVPHNTLGTIKDASVYCSLHSLIHVGNDRDMTQ